MSGNAVDGAAAGSVAGSLSPIGTLRAGRGASSSAPRLEQAVQTRWAVQQSIETGRGDMGPVEGSAYRGGPICRCDKVRGAHPKPIRMTGVLEGKVAVGTGAASGIGLASCEAMLAAGARGVMVDRDAVIPLRIDLLDPKACASLVPRALDLTGQIDILHADADSYVGGDLVANDTAAIGRMLHLNVNVVDEERARRAAAHDCPPQRRHHRHELTGSARSDAWKPVYASSKWAIHCFAQTVRRQVFKHGIRVGSISPGPVMTALPADWPAEKLQGRPRLGQPARGR